MAARWWWVSAVLILGSLEGHSAAEYGLFDNSASWASVCSATNCFPPDGWEASVVVSASCDCTESWTVSSSDAKVESATIVDPSGDEVSNVNYTTTPVVKYTLYRRTVGSYSQLILIPYGDTTTPSTPTATQPQSSYASDAELGSQTPVVFASGLFDPDGSTADFYLPAHQCSVCSTPHLSASVLSSSEKKLNIPQYRPQQDTTPSNDEIYAMIWGTYLSWLRVHQWGEGGSESAPPPASPRPRTERGGPSTRHLPEVNHHPRQQPGSSCVLIATVSAVLSFGAGVGCTWLYVKRVRRGTRTPFTLTPDAAVGSGLGVKEVA